jgi:hypothetical protein
VRRAHRNIANRCARRTLPCGFESGPVYVAWCARRTLLSGFEVFEVGWTFEATPLLFVDASLDELMEGGVWVFARTACEVVFDGIEVNVVGVACEFVVISDLVFPEAALPDAPFTAFAF